MLERQTQWIRNHSELTFAWLPRHYNHENSVTGNNHWAVSSESKTEGSTSRQHIVSDEKKMRIITGFNYNKNLPKIWIKLPKIRVCRVVECVCLNKLYEFVLLLLWQRLNYFFLSLNTVCRIKLNYGDNSSV